MRRTRQRAQIEGSGEFAVHDRFPLRTNEMQVVARAPDIDLLVRACGADAETKLREGANGATAQTETDFQDRASAYHRPLHRSEPCPAICETAAKTS